MDRMRERTEARIKAAKNALGELYILHPTNQVKRLPTATSN